MKSVDRSRSEPDDAAVSAARWMFAATAVAYVVGVVLQVLLAGAAMFELIDFVPHVSLGWGLGSAPLLLVLLAIVAQAGRRVILLTIALTLDAALQPELAVARDEWPLLAAFHPVNALLVFWLAIVVARRAVTLAREPASAGASDATVASASAAPGDD